jgi:hypothetical protein
MLPEEFYLKENPEFCAMVKKPDAAGAIKSQREFGGSKLTMAQMRVAKSFVNQLMGVTAVEEDETDTISIQVPSLLCLFRVITFCSRTRKRMPTFGT